MALGTTPGSIGSLAYSEHAVNITPHASNTFAAGRAFIADTDGTVTCRPVNSAADVAIPVIAGAIYPVSVVAVRATGTDSTAVTILY